MFFLTQAVLQYFSLFMVAIDISVISPQIKGELYLPQQHGDHPNYHFQPTFLLHTCGTHLSYGNWGKYIGYCSSNSPDIHKNIIGLPQYIYIGDRLLGNWWRCSQLPTSTNGGQPLAPLLTFTPYLSPASSKDAIQFELLWPLVSPQNKTAMGRGQRGCY